MSSRVFLDYGNENTKVSTFDLVHWTEFDSYLDESDFSEWPITKKDLDVHKYEAKKILNLKKDFFSDKFSKNLKIFNRVWSNVKFGEKYYEYIKKSKYIHLSLNTIFENFKGTNGFIEAANVSKNKTRYSCLLYTSPSPRD